MLNTRPCRRVVYGRAYLSFFVGSGLDFSLKCGYLDDKVHRELSAQYDEIGRMLGSMIASPEKFCTEFQKPARKH